MSVFVRARPCFWNGVFRGPKNGMTKTNKPPAMRVVEVASAYSKKTSHVIIMLVRQPHKTKEVIQDGCK